MKVDYGRIETLFAKLGVLFKIQTDVFSVAKGSQGCRVLLRLLRCNITKEWKVKCLT